MTQNGQPEPQHEVEGSELAEQPADGLVSWERWVAGIAGTGSAAAGGWSVFVSDNQAGSTALLIFGAVFLLIAVQGTAIRRATRESVELERRVLRQRVVIEARQRLTVGETDQAQAYIDGATDSAPEIANDKSIVEVAGEVYARQVGQAIVRVAVPGHSLEVSLERDFADARVRQVNDPNGPIIEVFCKYFRDSSRRWLARDWLIEQFERFRRSGPTLIVANLPLSKSAQNWMVAQTDFSHVRVVRWSDEEDDDNVGRALEALLPPSTPP